MKYRFLKSIIILLVLSVFAKIYQHNCVIRMSYKKESLQKKEHDLVKQKNKLLTMLYQFQDKDDLTYWACEEKGMEIIPLSRVISVTKE